MLVGMTRLLLAAALALGCGSGGGGTHCQVDGTYLVTFTQTAGTCQIGTVQSIVNTNSSAPDPDCTDSSVSSDGMCALFIESSCVNPVNGCRSTLTASYRFNADGSSGGGTVTGISTCPNGSACNATLSAVLVRQ